MEMQSSDLRPAGGEPNIGNRRAIVAALPLSLEVGTVGATMASRTGCMDALDGLRCWVSRD